MFSSTDFLAFRSYLEVKRVGDNATFVLDGNLNTRFTDSGALPTLRFFYANLFAPATHRSPNTRPPQSESRSPSCTPLKEEVDAWRCKGLSSGR